MDAARDRQQILFIRAHLARLEGMRQIERSTEATNTALRALLEQDDAKRDSANRMGS